MAKIGFSSARFKIEHSKFQVLHDLDFFCDGVKNLVIKALFNISKY